MSGFGGDLLAAVCGGGVASRSHSLLHVAEIPARGGEPVGWPDWVHPDLLGALAGRGIAAPWSHQVEAADLAHAGRDVVISTGTASGKSLAFQ